MLKEEGRQVAQHQQSEGGGHAGHPSPTSLKSFWCNKYDLPFGSLWSTVSIQGVSACLRKSLRQPARMWTSCVPSNVFQLFYRVRIYKYIKSIKNLTSLQEQCEGVESSKQIKLRYICVIVLTSLQMPRQLVMIIAFGKILGANAQNVYIKFLLFWGWMDADLTKGFWIQQVCKNN